MKNCKQTAEKCKQISKNRKKLPPLKRILALPIQGQKSIVLEIQPFGITDFDLGHPVQNLLYLVKQNQSEAPAAIMNDKNDLA